MQIFPPMSHLTSNGVTAPSGSSASPIRYPPATTPPIFPPTVPSPQSYPAIRPPATVNNGQMNSTPPPSNHFPNHFNQTIQPPPLSIPPTMNPSYSTMQPPPSHPPNMYHSNGNPTPPPPMNNTYQPPAVSDGIGVTSIRIVWIHSESSQCTGPSDVSITSVTLSSSNTCSACSAQLSSINCSASTFLVLSLSTAESSVDASYFWPSRTANALSNGCNTTWCYEFTEYESQWPAFCKIPWSISRAARLILSLSRPTTWLICSKRKQLSVHSPKSHRCHLC